MVSFLVCCVLLSSFLLLLSPSCVSPSCVLSYQDSSTYASHSLNNRATYTTKPFSKTMTITYGTRATCTFVAWIYLYICCLNLLVHLLPESTCTFVAWILCRFQQHRYFVWHCVVQLYSYTTAHTATTLTLSLLFSFSSLIWMEQLRQYPPQTTHHHHRNLCVCLHHLFATLLRLRHSFHIGVEVRRHLSVAVQ